MVQVIPNRKRFLLPLLLLMYGLTAGAVTFNFEARTCSAPAGVKATMERNISALLTEVNRAGSAGTSLNLASVSIEPEAKTRLVALWNESSRFVCKNITVVKKCLEDMQGYQVRGILITMKPVDDSYRQSLDRELTISLDKSGVITGVRPAWEIHEDVATMMKQTSGVTDLRQRREILKWVEDFRSFYNERNIGALEKIYSDDALIITGSVISRKRNESGIECAVKYTVKDKQTYINDLRNRVFNRNYNKYINVEFDHISISRHGSKPEIYGVALHQKWNTTRYSDDGWLFLLWDFTDREHPQIHVRTWQPQQAVAIDGLPDCDDFFFP